MTPDPTLTDEELAEEERRLREDVREWQLSEGVTDEELATLDAYSTLPVSHRQGMACAWCWKPHETGRLIIAALRASREAHVESQKDLADARHESQEETAEAWERYDVAIGIVRQLRAALGRAPEDWLKGDDEAWAVYTGDSGEPPPDYESLYRASQKEVEGLRSERP